MFRLPKIKGVRKTIEECEMKINEKKIRLKISVTSKLVKNVLNLQAERKQDSTLN